MLHNIPIANANQITMDALFKPYVPKAPDTTFRNNDYIERLNRTLQAEMRTIAACHNLAERFDSYTTFLSIMSDHHSATKELARLIIAHRGVPDDKSAFNLDLTQVWMRICSAIPVKLFERASISTLIAMEKGLEAFYADAMESAPFVDQEILSNLQALTHKHQCDLNAVFAFRKP